MMMMPMTRAAAIKGVDLGDTDDDDETDDSDVFLDDEEDEASTGVADLIGGRTQAGRRRGLIKTAELAD